ncbi:MAG: prolipoprotein diacylglyceryl transferase [Verrucomicrobiae bacterium]|nr:prolipoprotein diacylglyceryl transferase [Verrucomicrobiae bacterium]
MERIAFELGPLTLTWYGICVATGFWVGAWTSARRAPRAGVAAEAIWDVLWVLIVAGIVGARALYVVTYWDRSFRGEPWTEIFMVHHGGLVFHGGFVAAMLAGFAWCRWRRQPGWTMADILAPGVALGHAIGRIGCLLNGCCFGRACELPWAIRYGADHETRGIPVHPTQVYEAGLSLAVAGGLAWLFGRRRFEGQVFAVYLMAYGVIRSVVEWFRGDYPASALYFERVTPAHWISAGLVAVGVVLYGVRKRSGAAGRPALPSAVS